MIIYKYTPTFSGAHYSILTIQLVILITVNFSGLSVQRNYFLSNVKGFLTAVWAAGNIVGEM